MAVEVGVEAGFDKVTESLTAVSWSVSGFEVDLNTTEGATSVSASGTPKEVQSHTTSISELMVPACSTP